MGIERIATSQLSSQLSYQIKIQMQEQQRLYEQISTNKKINRASDDPVGTGQDIVLNQQLSRLDMYGTNIQSATTNANVASTALDSALQSWTRVNEIAISAADGTKTAADRQGMAQELEQILQGLVQTANTTSGGRYIFAGGQTDKPAFKTETDPTTGNITGVFYQGDSKMNSIATKDGSSIGTNLLGSNAGNPNAPGVFSDSTSGVDAFKTLIELRNKLNNNDTIGLSGTGGVLDKITQAARNLTAGQVRNGGTLQVLALDKNRNTADNSSIQQSISDVEKADSAQLALELNNVQNVYEAALAAGGRLTQTSLLNYL